ncbi:hypothetical protein ML462_02775 [Gramella lutea]|uniref:Uncharacterized protein n=1 Tax=Christiangramia lutea TaxID=1607951 RepID=A0A9X2A815_9FLAO|nr:hypothetical protein [Christiangramia lutea]MCH4822084.1 hypothetical protein [Christiangramia lutea]
MLRATSSKHTFLIFFLPLFLITCLVFLTAVAGFRENADLLSIGLTFDLLILIPFLYFLLIRKTKIPKTTILPIMILGLIICKFIIPAENQYFLDLFKTWGIPVAEVFVLGFVVHKVYLALKIYRSNNQENADFYNVLKKSCKEIFPAPLVIPMVTEMAVFYYGFFNWRKRDLKDHEFHYHKESGSIALFSAIIFLILVETVVLHILLAMWNETLALILTVLGLYSIMQLFGFTRSLSKRPVYIVDKKLFLNYGIMKETVIDLKNIVTVEISSRDIELDSDTAKLSLLGNLESHNIILHLKKEETLTSLYGKRKNFKIIALHIDDKLKFKEQIDAHKN